MPSIASLRAIAALKSTHLALVRPARLGLGFESAGGNQKSLAEMEDALGGPGRLSLSYSLRLLLDAMAGLSVLHRTLAFVHGEVQPQHVVLGEDGVGRLIPVVRAHWVRGEERAPERLYYLAPEKLLGDRVDVRADVFSAGVMLWEAISGQRLLEASSVADIIAGLMGGGIPRALAPEGEQWTEPLASIAERAIAVDPARRFATMAEMKEAIESAAARYLASTPGMVELFQNPEQRARSHGRDSVAPDSQRITLPPHQAPAAPKSRPPRESTEDAAPVQLSHYLEEELTTKPNAAPLPVAALRPHVSTLLGVAAPSLERTSSPPEEQTRRFNRRPGSAQVIITPLPLPPAGALEANAAVVPRAPLPSRVPTPLAFPPPPAPAPLELPRPAARAPLTAVQPFPSVPSVPSLTMREEPSFDLLRPRKRRGALWLVLGAAVAIGLFVARPWLAQQLAAATDGRESATDVHVDAAAIVPLAPANGGSAAPLPSSAPRPVGIASTPAAPASAPARPRVSREEHVVIHDTVDPSIRELAESPPVAAPPPAAPAPPAAEPPAPPAESPPASSKPKPPPSNDADRYGI